MTRYPRQFHYGQLCRETSQRLPAQIMEVQISDDRPRMPLVPRKGLDVSCRYWRAALRGPFLVHEFRASERVSTSAQ